MTYPLNSWHVALARVVSRLGPSLFIGGGACAWDETGCGEGRREGAVAEDFGQVGRVQGDVLPLAMALEERGNHALVHLLPPVRIEAGFLRQVLFVNANRDLPGAVFLVQGFDFPADGRIPIIRAHVVIERIFPPGVLFEHVAVVPLGQFHASMVCRGPTWIFLAMNCIVSW